QYPRRDCAGWSSILLLKSKKCLVGGGAEAHQQAAVRFQDRAPEQGGVGQPESGNLAVIQVVPAVRVQGLPGGAAPVDQVGGGHPGQPAVDCGRGQAVGPQVVELVFQLVAVQPATGLFNGITVLDAK